MAISTIFIDGSPEYKIVNGGVRITAPSGDFEFTIQIPFEHFIKGHVTARRVFEQISTAAEIECIAPT